MAMIDIDRERMSINGIRVNDKVRINVQFLSPSLSAKVQGRVGKLVGFTERGDVFVEVDNYAVHKLTLSEIQKV
jgi:hypothetical protein